MSMTLSFEPHSWYMGAAIQLDPLSDGVSSWKWTAYIEDGMRTYSIIEVHADTLAKLKEEIREYWQRENMPN